MGLLAPPRPLSIEEPSQVAAARREATSLAEKLGFDATAAGHVALVVTELATNILKHGGGGEILLNAIQRADIAGMEIVGLDRGKGIADLARSLRDGYSTAGSPGTGLGAIRRLATSFDISSAPSQGTAVVATLWARVPGREDGRRVSVGVAGAAHAGETVSGDAWAVDQAPGRTLLLLVDGLGHGQVAADAAHEAVRLFRANARRAPGEIVRTLHDGLRSTRGAAVAVTEISYEHDLVRFAGLGNISAVLVWPGGRRHLVSHNGTAGHAMRRIDEFSYPWPKTGVLVEHTDGLGTQWDLERYPGLLARSPSLVAAVLYRDFNRGRDDVAVLAASEAVR
jgi:anti-sigma regulatory factor (Ser/Thr protein kinase)